jgi:hypothetical protein
MARIASLSIWQNKNDQTVYYRGVKVFRGTPAEVTEFCDNFDFNGKRMSTNQFHALAEELGVDFGITENEAKVLRAIATNCFNVLNYGVPTCYEEANNDVWSDCIDDAKIPSGLTPRSLSGVCGSLARKGMVISSNWDDDERCIRLTEAGFDAMMKFYNNNLEA